MGSAIELHPFYNEDDFITHACFVHGRDEILFVDSSAQARIFSLTMLQPKYIRLSAFPCDLSKASSQTRLFTATTCTTRGLLFPGRIMRACCSRK
jgi:hypothetical protein